MIPYDEVFIEVPKEYYGVVIQKLNSKFGEMREMQTKNSIV